MGIEIVFEVKIHSKAMMTTAGMGRVGLVQKPFCETLVLESAQALERPEHVLCSMTISLVKNHFEEGGVMASPTHL